MKNTIAVAIGVLLVLLIAIGLYQQPNEQVISISEEPYLVIADKVYTDSDSVILDGETIYISYDIIKEHVDPNLFYDENEEMVIFTDDQRVLRCTINHKEASINHKKFYLNYPIKKVDNKIYIPEEVLYIYYNLEITHWEETNAIVVNKQAHNHLIGVVVQEGGDIRFSFSKKAPILLKDVAVNTELLVFEEYKDWYKVRTNDGIIGYMEKVYLKVDLINNTAGTNKAIGEGTNNSKERINLTWDYVHTKMVSIESIEPIYGVNVVSPTWFSIVSEEGDILDKGNQEYVSAYKNYGYQVWPLINNNFDPELTSKLLASSNKRQELIEKIAKIYDVYGVDGINIDFENVYMKDKELLTQFVRELYPVFKEKGMVVSMDVTPISVSENWSQCYDRKRLSETVDYIILMAYDQHWSTSPVEGSVAQYSWVEESLQAVLKEVPNEKLILGVPFYSRLWTIRHIDGKEEVSSKALSMDEVNSFIEENNVELIWEEESGQYYGEVSKDGITYKIWLEDTESLQLKASLVNKYQLAGIASWRKGFEKGEVWPAISNTINFN